MHAMYRSDAGVDRSILVIAFAGKLFGIERASGATLWKVEIDGSYSSSVVEIEMGDEIVIACTSNRLAFVEYRTGKVLKNVERKETAGRTTIMIDGDQMFLSSPGLTSCYTLQGDLVWHQGFKGEGYGEIAMGLPGHVRQADDRGSK